MSSSLFLDITVTPGSAQPHGIETSLFDAPTILLLVEVGLVAASFYPYVRATQPKPGRGSTPLQVLAGVFLFEQIQFSFLGAPTHETRWVHAPMFLATIASTLYVLKWLDDSREPRLAPTKPDKVADVYTDRPPKTE